MKYVALVFVGICSSLSIHAMFKAPDVTKWRDICKDPDKKERLITVYTQFCRDRLIEHSSWAGAWSGGLVIGKLSRVYAGKPTGFGGIGIAGLLWGMVAYNFNQYQCAQKGDFSFLDNDVLKQLGKPKVVQGPVASCQRSIPVGEYKWRGIYYKQTREWREYEVSVHDVEGIEKALSGEHCAKEMRDYSVRNDFYSPCDCD